MDDYERGLFTGCGIACGIFLIVFIQVRLDARENAKANARWFREHEDLRAPDHSDASRAEEGQGAWGLGSRDSRARGTK